MSEPLIHINQANRRHTKPNPRSALGAALPVAFPTIRQSPSQINWPWEK